METRKDNSPSQEDRNRSYWRTNLLFVSVLLFIWFLFACVLSIIGVEKLNQIHLAGFPLGFWIAQQGSIYVFIVLIFVYAYGMDRLESKHRTQASSSSKSA